MRGEIVGVELPDMQRENPLHFGYPSDLLVTFDDRQRSRNRLKIIIEETEILVDRKLYWPLSTEGLSCPCLKRRRQVCKYVHL